MKFEELNIEDKKNALDLMCILSANVNNLYDPRDRPERTEDEILDASFTEVLKWWGEYLLSFIRENKQ